MDKSFREARLKPAHQFNLFSLPRLKSGPNEKHVGLSRHTAGHFVLSYMGFDNDHDDDHDENKNRCFGFGLFRSFQLLAVLLLGVWLMGS